MASAWSHPRGIFTLTTKLWEEDCVLCLCALWWGVGMGWGWSSVALSIQKHFREFPQAKFCRQSFVRLWYFTAGSIVITIWEFMHRNPWSFVHNLLFQLIKFQSIFFTKGWGSGRENFSFFLKQNENLCAATYKVQHLKVLVWNWECEKAVCPPAFWQGRN